MGTRCPLSSGAKRWLGRGSDTANSRQKSQRSLSANYPDRKLDLAGYFLIVWDIVRFCNREKILAQGRGSAANSAVCYSLGITAVDSIGMNLLFERF